MKKRRKLDLTRPVAVWRSKDLLDGEPVGCLTIILRTRGCRWNRCTMCGFAAEGAPVTAEELMTQFQTATHDLSSQDKMVKIYTSGSFLDPVEVPDGVRVQILDNLSSFGVDKVIIESRPEYVTSEIVQDCVSRMKTEVATGLETSNDLIRIHAICKGFTFDDFKTASKIVHQNGGTVKTYLLLKPPFLSEGVAISDALKSAQAAVPYTDILSLNLCNIQRGTFLEQMWQQGDYRPPWLWSAVKVLTNVTSVPIVCDPVAAGARRGPHNCGQCDRAIGDAIREFSLAQDPSIFEKLNCECKATWEKVVVLEDLAFGSSLG
ncbi:MAG: archaeosine biosynthesis radical SAM protein RaSEA [Methanotrichaceae archaeon]